jgi:hypothetical protein
VRRSSARTPCEGIYYVVREPSGWRLATYRFVHGEDYSHQAMWEKDIVPGLASQWAAELRGDERELENLLKIMVFAFPRGRVTNVKDKYVIYHGNDLKTCMHVTKKAVEQAFHIVGRCRWQIDDHERCVDFEMAEVRQALCLSEDWPAAPLGESQ